MVIQDLVYFHIDASGCWVRMGDNKARVKAIAIAQEGIDGGLTGEVAVETEKC